MQSITIQSSPDMKRIFVRFFSRFKLTSRTHTASEPIPSHPFKFTVAKMVREPRNGAIAFWPIFQTSNYPDALHECELSARCSEERVVILNEIGENIRKT